MTDEKRDDNRSLFDGLVPLLSRLPWLEALREAFKILQRLMRTRSRQGIYEVLEYESTLELKDR
jgi:hypothetical protein